MGYDKNRLAEFLRVIYANTSEGSNVPEASRRDLVPGRQWNTGVVFGGPGSL